MSDPPFSQPNFNMPDNLSPQELQAMLASVNGGGYRQQMHPSMAAGFYPNYQFASNMSAGAAPAPAPSPSSGLTPDVYQQLINTIRGLEERLEEQSELVSSLLAAPGTAPLPQTPETRRDNKLGSIVRTTMLSLVGISSRQRASTGELLEPLPDPLSFGEPQRTDGSKDANPLFNPAWNDASTVFVNDQYINRAADLIIQQETNEPTLVIPPTRTAIIRACRQYFRTLRKDYNLQQSTPAGEQIKARVSHKNTLNSRRNRKRKKCDDRRKAIPQFRAVYGEANTEGIETLLLTDYMSSEHSDRGTVSTEEFEAHRRSQGVSAFAFESRRVEWRSTWLNRLYSRLSGLTEATRNTTSAEVGRHGSRVGRSRTTRYRGLAANSNAGPPPSRRTPFQSLVSQAWVHRTNNTTMAVFQDPDNFSIFKLSIPDDDLDAADLEYFAEDEGDGSDDAAGGGAGDGDGGASGASGSASVN